MEEEINKRITLTWNKYWSLKYIFKGPYSNKQKSEIFNSCVLPTLLYGSQTWSLTKKQEQKIKTIQNSIEQSILKIKIKDRIKIQKIKKLLNKSKNAVTLGRQKNGNGRDT